MAPPPDLHSCPMPSELDLYELQLQVDRLRHHVFTELTGPEFAAQLQELSRLEAQLREKQQPPATPAHPHRGVILDTSKGRSKDDFVLGAETTKLSAKALLRMSHVPTGIVHLLNAETEPLVSFELQVEQGRDFARLRVTSYVEGYSARATDTLEIFEGKPATLKHLPTFFPERLRQVQEQTRATLHIEIDDLGGLEEGSGAPRTELHRSLPIWLLPPTTAYLEVRDPATNTVVDVARYFAAWVTPNAPEVLTVVRKAADLAPGKRIIGYQGPEQNVLLQVEALFNALQKEGLAYVNTVFANGGDSYRYFQRVRLPREALKGQSANCIDGTVLFASLLEAASLFAGIVIIPGHAFVAWKRSRDPAKDDWSYLETTLIGTSDFKKACATGEQLAGQYSTDRRLLKLPELRAQGIIPME